MHKKRILLTIPMVADRHLATQAECERGYTGNSYKVLHKVVVHVLCFSNINYIISSFQHYFNNLGCCCFV